jgi:hypothetical protein
MGPQPMGKVPDLRRLAGRVAPRSTVPWSWPWTFPRRCFLAAVAGGRAVCLLHARVVAVVAGVRRSARGPASLWQAITFGQPGGTARNRLGATGPPGKSQGLIRLGDTVSSSTQNCESCK